jgi:diguanylate cyclase (GGDEF)-like protein
LLIARLMALQESVDSTPILVDGAAIRVTISVGVALRRAGDSFEQLYSRADQALYAAKNSGRDRICFFPAAESPGERDRPFAAGDAEGLARRA